MMKSPNELDELAGKVAAQLAARMPPIQQHQAAPVQPSQSPTAQDVFKWAAGIVAFLVGAGIIAYFNGQSTGQADQDRAIDKWSGDVATLRADFTSYQEVESLRNEQQIKQLNRIEANTRDRITRAETMREVVDLQEQIVEVRALAKEASDKLLARNEFMFESVSDRAAIKEEMDALTAQLESEIAQLKAKLDELGK
ncbi:hypothetical protein [Litorimonas sp. WD9-15]|uniref:hypothetical protein n=1 Tax=Litorimonas sp. WD9-15 TaxID=3418716 RepID=UPI003CFD3A5E